MKFKFILGALAALALTSASIVNAEQSRFGFGIAGGAGNFDTSGTETEGTAADTSTRTANESAGVPIANFFMEYAGRIDDWGATIGLNVIPGEHTLGKRSRTDSDGDDAAENDDGTRTASATIEDFITLYTNIPIMGSNMYLLGGIHSAEIITTETLQTSKYPNEHVLGYQVGLGYRAGKFKAQVYYSDFGDIDLQSDQNNGQKIEASADATAFTISYGF